MLWFSWVQVVGTCRTAPSEDHMYCLVSVVQHFGRAGSGHYTVYRTARAEANPNGSLEESSSHWFCISDSNVYSVTKKDVLAAEASLLFYEKISENGENYSSLPVSDGS